MRDHLVRNPARGAADPFGIKRRGPMKPCRSRHWRCARRNLTGASAWNRGSLHPSLRRRVRRLITEEIPAKVAGDIAYRNARENSDRQNARIEHDQALKRVMTAVLNDDMQLFKQFTDNEGFRRWLTDNVFGLTDAPPQAKNQTTARD